MLLIDPFNPLRQMDHYGPNYHQDLKKQRDLRNFLVLLGVTPLWLIAQLVSRAPPHHTLPDFLNLNGRTFDAHFETFIIKIVGSLDRRNILRQKTSFSTKFWKFAYENWSPTLKWGTALFSTHS